MSSGKKAHLAHTEAMISDEAYAAGLQLAEIDALERSLSRAEPGSDDLATALSLMKLEITTMQTGLGDRDLARRLHVVYGTAVRQQRANDTTAAREYGDYVTACRLAGQAATIAPPAALTPQVAVVKRSLSEDTASEDEGATDVSDDEARAPQTGLSAKQESTRSSSTHRSSVVSMFDKWWRPQQSITPPLATRGTCSTSGTSASQGASRQSIKEDKNDCSVCMERKASIVQLACEHRVCNACLTEMHTRALDDPSLIPLRCCKTLLDTSLAQRVLSGSQYRRYQAFLEENTATNRMYCPKPACSKFINLDKMAMFSSIPGPGGSRILCPGCKEPLCGACKLVWHEGISCETAQKWADTAGGGSGDVAALKTLAAQVRASVSAMHVCWHCSMQTYTCCMHIYSESELHMRVWNCMCIQ